MKLNENVKAVTVLCVMSALRNADFLTVNEIYVRMQTLTPMPDCTKITMEEVNNILESGFDDVLLLSKKNTPTDNGIVCSYKLDSTPQNNNYT